MTNAEMQDTEKTKDKKQRILTNDMMTDLVNKFIEKGKSLGEGEKINVNEFCNDHNIILHLFYQISAEVSQRTGAIYPFEKTEGITRKRSKHVAVVGKRGNININPKIVEFLNKNLEDEDKIIDGDEFDIDCSKERIILKKIKR